MQLLEERLGLNPDPLPLPSEWNNVCNYLDIYYDPFHEILCRTCLARNECVRRKINRKYKGKKI